MVYTYLERQLAMQTSKIIALCDNQKEELAEKFCIASPEKFTVIPLGFDLDKFRVDRQSKRVTFRQKYHLDDDEIAIGIIGRLTGVKNHHLFLLAFKEVVGSTEKKVRAFIIGDGELKSDLQDFCHQNHLSYNVDTNNHKTLLSKTGQD